MTLQYSQTIQKLWALSGSGFGFLATLDRNSSIWEDIPHEWDEPLDMAQPENTDLFFSPLTYERPRRLVTLHNPGHILFADLDPVNPETLEIPPHIWWETSPGSYQAIWKLDQPVKYRTAWSDLNRRMTYTTQADKGGWAGSKVLRVPGTYNWKRNAWGGPPMEDEDLAPYTHTALDRMLIPSAMITSAPEIGDHPPIETDLDALDAMWRSLSAHMQWELNNKRVRDRSVHIVKMAHLLRKAGVSKTTAYHMLWYAPFNKWRARNNPQRLWIEVSTVFDGQ